MLVLIEFFYCIITMNIPVHLSRTILAITMILFFLSVPVLSQQHIVNAQTSATGILIPLYSYPGSTWQQLIQTKLANPSVPVAAIVNPDNGPGTYQDPNYAQSINELRSAGILVLGYVPTGYGSISQSHIDSQIYDYKQWYNANGIFFDTMSNVPGYENYYSSLSSYAHSLGFSWTVGNPGAPVPASYIGTMNTLNIYENAGLPSLSRLASSTDSYPASNFAFEAYSVSSISQSYIASAESYDSWMYITNGVYPNPYTILPSYLATFMTDLGDSANPTQPISQSVPLTIDTVNQNGASINGLYTVIRSSAGATLATGFSPMTYDATAGLQYTVTVSNYGSYYFSSWSTGATSASISITPTQSTTLTAHYQDQSEPIVTIESKTQSGASISGLYAIIKSASGSTIASGFTPFSFQGTFGATYIVAASNYGSFSFIQWSSGSTDRYLTLTLSQSTTLIAYYS
jgi:hypothetical protein